MGTPQIRHHFITVVIYRDQFELLILLHAIHFLLHFLMCVCLYLCVCPSRCYGGEECHSAGNESVEL